MVSSIYLGIGSNLGDRYANIRTAVELMGKIDGLKVKRISSLYETEPFGSPPQGRFLNGVVEVETRLSPKELLEKLKEIEQRLGRVKTVQNGPRTIDLDILLYKDLVVDDEDLKIPHPRMAQRRFVLEPLAELNPDLIHPISNKKVSQLFKEVKGGRSDGSMKVINDIAEMRTHINEVKRDGKTVGFVPTMGYLHEGHLSLIREARSNEDVVVISIFVNPTQFGPSEDYKRYPRGMERDKRLARRVGVDLIFTPTAAQMYPEGYHSYVNVEEIIDPLCGPFRPGHFKGVATVCCKLFNIVEPDVAYFGQKDAQQALVIKRMVRDLNMDFVIKVLPIVREEDGLAISSRNAYLSPKERMDALCLYQSLEEAKRIIASGESDPEKVIRRMRQIIKPKATKIDYISIVDTEDLKEAKELCGELLVALAVWIGKTRLIDNMIVNCERIRKC